MKKHISLNNPLYTQALNLLKQNKHFLITNITPNMKNLSEEFDPNSPTYTPSKLKNAFKWYHEVGFPINQIQII